MSMQVTKVWWDGEKLMAEPIDPASVYKEDSTCNKTLIAQGKANPRTCKKCGLGPCIADRVQPAQQEPVAIVDGDDHGYFAEILPDRSVKVGQLLYSSPSAQRTWVGLTHEEHMEIMTGTMTTSSRMAAVEAKLKEKNNGN